MTPSLGAASASVLIATFLLLGADKAGLLRKLPPRPVPPTVVSSSPATPVQAAAAPAVPEIVETPDVLPAGTGRDETFYACTACHSSAIVRRSNFSRERWDELLHWMTRVHGMPVLEGSDRTTVLDYLVQHYGPTTGESFTRSPFVQPQRRNPFLDN